MTPSLAALAVLCFATRLAFLGRYPEGWDSINFLLALRDYDLAAGQPHFPGYPVYIFAGRLVHLLLADETAALLVAGAFFGSLAVIPLCRLVARLFNRRVAVAVGLFYIANPLLFLEAEKIFSDAFSLFFLLAAADFAEEATAPKARDARRTTRAGYLAGLFAGLTLGARLSSFPCVLSLAAWLTWAERGVAFGTVLSARGHRRLLGAPVLVRANPRLPDAPPSVRQSTEHRRQSTASAAVHGAVHGVGVWLIPLLWITGVQPFLEAGREHLSGHFAEWGGTVWTRGDPGVRLLAFVWALAANGLGAWWPDAPWPRLLTTLLLVIAIAGYVGRYARTRATAFLFLLTAPYALWVYLGQNLENPRHVLPLVALLLPVIAAGFAALPPERCGRAGQAAALVALVIAWTATAIPLVRENRETPPTRVQMVDYLRGRFEPRQSAVVCWNSARHFDYLAPEWSNRTAGSVEEGIALAGRGGVVLLVSDLPDFDVVRRSRTLRLLTTFRRGRYVHNYLHTLSLYSLEPAPDGGAVRTPDDG